MIPVEMANDAIPGGDAGLGTERDAVPVVILCRACRARKDRRQEEGTGQGRAPGGAAGEAVTLPLPLGKGHPTAPAGERVTPLLRLEKGIP